MINPVSKLFVIITLTMSASSYLIGSNMTESDKSEMRSKISQLTDDEINERLTEIYRQSVIIDPEGITRINYNRFSPELTYLQHERTRRSPEFREYINQFKDYGYKRREYTGERTLYTGERNFFGVEDPRRTVYRAHLADEYLKDPKKMRDLSGNPYFFWQEQARKPITKEYPDLLKIHYPDASGIENNTNDDRFNVDQIKHIPEELDIIEREIEAARDPLGFKKHFPLIAEPDPNAGYWKHLWQSAKWSALGD